VFQTSEMLPRIHELAGEAARLGPALPLAIVFALALVEAAVLPWRYWSKGAWALAVVLVGLGAAGLLHWERETSGRSAADQLTARLAAETAALHGLWSQWDALSKTLPPPSGESPAASFDNVDDALASLSAKVAVVTDQVAALKGGETARTIDPTMAVKLGDYLRQYGSYRVVVSCVPSDVEAYGYATQLVNILKSAGWDANGPEQTANIVEGTAMGITVFDRDPSAPDAAKILLDAFRQFDIPYQVGITAEYAVPDSATVELFVPKKP
jgi:hypothetical protein